MCDISAKQIVAKEDYGQFCHILRRYLDEFGRERVMFGTDAPLLERAASSTEWVEIVKSLPEKAPAHSRFTEEEVSAILAGNARRLLDSIPEI
jgi:predicted TIM-barrel fold metal-dependent hydrolase